MIKEESQERIDFESLYNIFSKNILDDNMKKPRMKPFYNKAMYSRYQIQI